MCRLKVLFSPNRPSPAILNTNVSLWISTVYVSPCNPGFHSTFSSLVQVYLSRACLGNAQHLHTCLFSLHSLKPLSWFDSTETNPSISCSKLQSLNLCELLTDMCPQRTQREKHFDSMHCGGKRWAVRGGKRVRSLI